MAIADAGGGPDKISGARKSEEDAAMTEADWLECVDPWRMLTFLGDRADARKKRLLACACVRRVWPLLLDKRLRKAIRLAERVADGQVAEKHLGTALVLVNFLREELMVRAMRKPGWPARAARVAVHAAAVAVQGALSVKGPRLEKPCDIRDPLDVLSATRFARTAARAHEAQREERLGESSKPRRGLESLDAVQLLRELFGNPFRPVTVDPAWLAWNERAIPKMALAMYDKRRFRGLPALADELEKAGCVESDILSHCRAPTAHVRGCWVVDALLGMK
jgi:hypothetical protein